MKLMKAIANGDFDTIKTFIFDHESEFNAPDEFGNSPLLFATFLGDIGLINYLIDQGADINLPNQGGITPLIYAVMKQNYPIIELLIDRGATADQIKDLPIDITKILTLFEQATLFDNNLAKLADSLVQEEKVGYGWDITTEGFSDISKDAIDQLLEKKSPIIKKSLKRVRFDDECITSIESKSSDEEEQSYKEQKISFLEEFDDNILLGLSSGDEFEGF